jgi:hypothetical protein
MLADQLAWRRVRGSARDLASFHAFVSARDPDAWPETPAELAAHGTIVRPRQAYRVLAARAGLSIRALNFELFARTGPWDARVDDDLAGG